MKRRLFLFFLFFFLLSLERLIPRHLPAQLPLARLPLAIAAVGNHALMREGPLCTAERPTQCAHMHPCLRRSDHPVGMAAPKTFLRLSPDGYAAL